MPMPPPPADGLMSTGKPIDAADAAERRVGLIRRRLAGTIGHAGRLHQRRAPIFEPMRSMASARRPDERQAGVVARAREVRALGQKAVAGMDGVGAWIAARRRAARACSGNSAPAPAAPIGSARSAASTCGAPAIGLRIDRDATRSPSRGRRGRSATRDLTAVGDEQPPHHRSCRRGPSDRPALVSRNARRPVLSLGRHALRGDGLAVDDAIASLGDAAPDLGNERFRRGDAARRRATGFRRGSARPSASSSAARTTAWTSPISLARAASKRMPVRNSSRAADGPIFGSTYGEITAGRMPSLVSVNPKTALSSATTMSQMAARPAPPPSAAPWMRPITAAGSVSRASNISAIRRASSRFSSCE